MSNQVNNNYTFDVSLGTITLTDYTTLHLERLKLIVDVTTNQIIYNFADPSISSATVAGNIITLTTMTGVSNGDKLQITYDSLTADPSYDSTKIADGANVVEGSINDSANTTGAVGSISGKLRGLTTILGNVWDSVNNLLRVSLATAIAGEDLANNVLGINNKPVSGPGYAPLSYLEAASTTAANIKPSSGNIYSFYVTNSNASTRYIQFFNSATAPTAGNAAQVWWPILPGAPLNIPSGALAPSEYFTTGISMGISTTATTYTAATASDHTLMVRYI